MAEKKKIIVMQQKSPGWLRLHLKCLQEKWCNFWVYRVGQNVCIVCFAFLIYFQYTIFGVRGLIRKLLDAKFIRWSQNPKKWTGIKDTAIFMCFLFWNKKAFLTEKQAKSPNLTKNWINTSYFLSEVDIFDGKTKIIIEILKVWF